MPKNPIDSDKYDWTWVSSVLWLLLFLVACIAGYMISTNVLGQHYGVERQHDSYDKSTNEGMAAFEKSIVFCNDQLNSNNDACAKFDSVTSDVIAELDLATNRRVAFLTEGALDVGILQLWLTGAAFILLVVTVRQTGGALREAQQAAKFAIRSANAAETSERAHLYGGAKIRFGTRPHHYMDNLSPALSPIEPGPEFYEDKSRLIIEFWIENYGKTPALNASFQLHRIDGDNVELIAIGSGLGVISAAEVVNVHSLEVNTFDYTQLTEWQESVQAPFLITVDYIDIFDQPQGPKGTRADIFFVEKPGASFQPISSKEKLADLGGIERVRADRLFQLVEPRLRLRQNTQNIRHNSRS